MKFPFGSLIFRNGVFLALAASSLHAKPARELEFMFYNTYNLFDAEHEAGKDDWTFLPAQFPGKTEECEKISNPSYRYECLNLNWTEDSVTIKLNQIKKAVFSATGSHPDLLGVAEVENQQVVEKLAQTLGMQRAVVTNSPDKRGIDVGLIFSESEELEYKSHREHEVTLPGGNKGGSATRNILEVEFKAFQTEQLIVFVNHWPSQAAPTSFRMAAASQLAEIIKQRLWADPSTHIVVMGDFNVTRSDYPNPFSEQFENTDKAFQLKDTREIFLASSVTSEVKNQFPHGTYFYPPAFSWEYLDRFFISANLRDRKSMEFKSDSFAVVSNPTTAFDYVYDNDLYYSFGSVVKRVPHRANIYAQTAEDAGFSDHFPIYMKLYSKLKAPK